MDAVLSLELTRRTPSTGSALASHTKLVISIFHQGDTYIDKGYSVNFRDLESGSGTKKEEMDANAFAAALLMPAAWVETAYQKKPFDLTDDESLQKLARKFKVSTLAMTYRLMKLQYSLELIWVTGHLLNA